MFVRRKKNGITKHITRSKNDIAIDVWREDETERSQAGEGINIMNISHGSLLHVSLDEYRET
jgi:hypothetical protein